MPGSEGWQTLSSRVVYRSRWLTVRHDDLQRPDGSPGEYDVLEKLDFVMVIAQVDGGLCLVEQYRYPARERSWEFPQGGWGVSEVAEACGRRELREETGLCAQQWTRLGYLRLANGYSTQGFSVLLAEDCTFGERCLDPSEADLIVTVYTEAEVRALIRTGVIKDSPTVAAFTLYLPDQWAECR